MQVTDLLPPAGGDQQLIPIDITIDQEGNWFYQGQPIIRENILELFYDNLKFEADSRAFVIQWQGRRYRLQVNDSPYVITRVDRREEGGTATIELTLKHRARRETLDPATLTVGAHHVLYCRTQDGRMPTRFSRPAYYQLAQWINQDPESQEFFLELNGVRYVVGEAPEGD